MPTYRKPLTAADARILEWDTLLGIVTYGAQDVKRHVEDRSYEDFFIESSDTITALNELRKRMQYEQDKAARPAQYREIV